MMFGVVFWTIAIACVLSITCAMAGVLLVAKKEALISEGLSHAVLPGITIAYIFLRDQQSPILILSAAASGYLMIASMQLLKKTRLIQSDAALGVTFSTLFSLGIILANLYLKNSPVGAHCIIDGNLADAYQNKMEILGTLSIPKSFFVMTLNLTALLCFLLLCYKELKLMVFDPVLARSLGYRPGLMHSLWLALVSVICVSAFETAGAVLVVALMITPAATAFLITKKLHWAFVISGLVSILAVVGGFYLALRLDISQTGPIASLSGGIFILALLFAPGTGLISSISSTNQTQRSILADCLICRLNEFDYKETKPRSVAEIFENIGIDQKLGRLIVRDLQDKNLVAGSSPNIWLTEEGKEKAEKLTKPDRLS